MSAALNRSTARARLVSSPVFRPAALGAAAVAGCIAVAAWNPSDNGSARTCPTKALLGLDCPLCGGTRAVAQLVRGNVAAAADHNLIVTALAPVAVVLWVAWMWCAITGRPLPTITARPWHGWVVGAFMLAFAVVRNVKPGTFGAWLASETYR